MNKLRLLAISIIEEVEEHVNNHEKPFDKEEWYFIEDKINDLLNNYLVGEEE